MRHRLAAHVLDEHVALVEQLHAIHLEILQIVYVHVELVHRVGLARLPVKERQDALLERGEEGLGVGG